MKNNLSSLPTEITCPITGITHRIIRGSVEEDASILEKWAIDAKSRIENGSYIHISIDTECASYVPECGGRKRLRMSSMQFAEFTDNVNIEAAMKGPVKIDLSIKPGFIVFFPILPKIQKVIESIFNCNQCILYFYDISADITYMLLENLQFRNTVVFDVQTRYLSRFSNVSLFMQPSNHKLLKCVEDAVGTIPLAEAAVKFMHPQKELDHNLLYFMKKYYDIPYPQNVTPAKLRYCCGDIVLTAIAAAMAYHDGCFMEIIEKTQLKLRDLTMLSTAYSCERGAILYRSYIYNQQFVERLFSKDIPIFRYGRDSDLTWALHFFSKTASTLSMFELNLPSFTEEKLKKTVEAMDQCFEFLKQKPQIDRLLELAKDIEII